MKIQSHFDIILYFYSQVWRAKVAEANLSEDAYYDFLYVAR